MNQTFVSDSRDPFKIELSITDFARGVGPGRTRLAGRPGKMMKTVTLSSIMKSRRGERKANESNNPGTLPPPLQNQAKYHRIRMRVRNWPDQVDGPAVQNNENHYNPHYFFEVPPTLRKGWRGVHVEENQQKHAESTYLGE